MRTFVGLWPPPGVVAQLAALARPEMDRVRWTTPAQWHVTLAFVGEVADGALPALAQSVADAVRGTAPVVVELGQAVVLADSGVLALEVGGLEDLADAVGRAAAAVPGAVVPPRPFRGHLTLARPRGRGRSVPGSLLEGRPVPARWEAGEVALVVSDLRPEGAHYETVATVPLGQG